MGVIPAAFGHIRPKALGRNIGKIRDELADYGLEKRMR